MDTLRYRLRFTNHQDDLVTYFQSFGDPWPHRPDLRLIKKVTTIETKGKIFDTYTNAVEALSLAGDPVGWEIIKT